MANYPTSDPSFPTRVDGTGNTILAAHINSIQDEVVAIGSALRGTLAHTVTIGSTHSLNVVGGNSTFGGAVQIAGNTTLAGAMNAGNSTLANLSVTGGSTFAGGLTFGGLLTASSGIAVSTGLVRQNSLPAWNVYHSTHVALAGGATAGLSFDSQSFVRGNIGHSTTTNSSRITINSTGLYGVIARSYTNMAGSGSPRMYIQFNDVTPLLQSHFNNNVANGRDWTAELHGVIQMSDTGYLTLVAVSSGANSTWGSSAVVDATRFMGYFIG